MPLEDKSPDYNPCLPFIVNIYFLVRVLEISVLQDIGLGIKIHNAQSSLSNLQDFHDSVQPLGSWRPFSTTPLRLWLWELSLTVFYQSYQYFNILFSRCLSTMYFLLLKALRLEVMRKSFLIFKKALLIQACAQHIPYRLPCPLPRDLPNLGIKPRSTTLQVDSLLSEPQGSPKSGQ